MELQQATEPGPVRIRLRVHLEKAAGPGMAILRAKRPPNMPEAWNFSFQKMTCSGD
jgi:hypothetical protein